MAHSTAHQPSVLTPHPAPNPLQQYCTPASLKVRRVLQDVEDPLCLERPQGGLELDPDEDLQHTGQTQALGDWGQHPTATPTMGILPRLRLKVGEFI